MGPPVKAGTVFKVHGIWENPQKREEKGERGWTARCKEEGQAMGTIGWRGSFALVITGAGWTGRRVGEA